MQLTANNPATDEAISASTLRRLEFDRRSQADVEGAEYKPLSSCPLCGCAADKPQRVYKTNGLVLRGCTGAFHTGQLTNPEDRAFHRSPHARARRRSNWMRATERAEQIRRGLTIQLASADDIDAGALATRIARLDAYLAL